MSFTDTFENATDYTTMTRDEIRYDLTTVIGDAELPEDVREALVLDLEDLDAVGPDEFWTRVEAAFDAYEGAQTA